jgi:hypothetical protein
MSSSAEKTQSSAPKKISSVSVEQQKLPEPWDESGAPHPAWSVPAEDEEYAEAAAYLMAAVEPEASDSRMQTVARLLRTRDYTRAELMLAMKELPFDPEASHNYGKGFNPADVERIVSEHRTLRQRLTQSLSSKDRDELIAKFPENINPDAFHCCGFNSYDEPLWRYAPNVDTEPKEPTPALGESLPDRERDESGACGLSTFGGLVSEAQEKVDE